MAEILIVEDDRDLNRGLLKALKSEQNCIFCCWDLKSARSQIGFHIPDLVILDINLPDGSGLTLLDELSKISNRPAVILLTANDSDEDVVEGLELGADDYITKPFSLAVLRARVQTQLRKHGQGMDSIIKIGSYEFNFACQQFFVDGALVDLSKSEQKLLWLLVSNRGRILERSVLIDRIWTDGSDFVDENALSVTVKRLRDKLCSKDCIKTVYGIGYVWEK